MFKIVLYLFFLILTDYVYSQQTVNEQIFKDYSIINKPEKSNQDYLSFKTSITEPQPLWLNFSEAIITEFNSGKFWPMPLWPDSNVVIASSGTLPFYYDIHSFVTVLDPVSNLLSSYVNIQQNLNNADLWYDKNKRYHIDSVKFYYSYENPNNSVDTLQVYLILPGSSALEITEVENFLGSGEKFDLLLVNYDHTKNAPSGSNIIKHTILLSNQDTVALPNLKNIVLPLNISLPADAQNENNKIGIAFSFIPGHSYYVGDTLIDQTNNQLEIKNKLSLFRLLTFEENYFNNQSQAPLSYYEKTLNQSGIATKSVRYNKNIDGWNGRYINTFAFLNSFVYEHAYIDWYIKPVGNIFTYSPGIICVDQEISFTESSNFGPTNWLWNFGDGNTSTDKNPVHTFTSPGSRLISVISWNNVDTFSYNKTVNIDWCSNIKESEKIGFDIYPNPVNNILHIEKGTDRDVRILIRNVNGMILIDNSFESADAIRLDVKSLPAGFYILELRTNKGKISKSFVKI